MAGIKWLISSVVCGLSTFSIMPNTDYRRCISHNTYEITKKSWNKTGFNLNKAMLKVGGRSGREAKKG